MRKRGNPDSEPNIRRIDTKTRAKKQTHGFQVHFLRGTEVLTKMFSDTIYGGEGGARRAGGKVKGPAPRGLSNRGSGGVWATTLARPREMSRKRGQQRTV